MDFALDSTTLVLVFAAISVVLVAEAVYLLFFSRASYRSHVNRRLRLTKNEPDHEKILVQLRRERGLTGEGFYRFGSRWFNNLLLESGLTTGPAMLVVLAVIGGAGAFFGVTVARESMIEAGFAGVAAAALLPFGFLQVLRKRRHRKFGEQFPEAMDIIVRSLRAGHPVPVAISMVARELPDPIGTEFGLAADEITYGADVETAMRNLYFRVGQEDLPLFVTAVSIQGSTGGNLSEILENLSAVIRMRFKMRRKVKALASEGKFSALFLSGLPIAIFALLSLVAPTHYGSVWQFDTTKIGLALAGAWMIAGNIVMYRMVNFKI
jgi:tight adherence protein B